MWASSRVSVSNLFILDTFPALESNTKLLQIVYSNQSPKYVNCMKLCGFSRVDSFGRHGTDWYHSWKQRDKRKWWEGRVGRKEGGKRINSNQTEKRPMQQHLCFSEYQEVTSLQKQQSIIMPVKFCDLWLQATKSGLGDLIKNKNCWKKLLRKKKRKSWNPCLLKEKSRWHCSPGMQVVKFLPQSLSDTRQGKWTSTIKYPCGILLIV